MALAPVIGECRWESEGEAVSTAGRWTPDYIESTTGQEQWYAVQTRSRHEKSVAALLQVRGIYSYLPLRSEVHNWSDRRKAVEVPVFAGYVFMRSDGSNESMSRVIRTDGVASILGTRTGGTPIPDEEIESIKRLLEQKTPYRDHAFLNVGQRVRIRGGALDGIEGILMEQRSETSLVISVKMIQRSIAMRIDGLELEAVDDLP